jgi:hypothetical protein
MEARNDYLFLDYMPSVGAYKTKFDSLNGLLNKTTLTGKISSLEIAENLFTFMDETQQKFSILQANLISTLLHENFKKVFIETMTVSQIGIDIINRTLVERSINVELIVQDYLLRSYLLQEQLPKRDLIESRLIDIVKKYTIIDDLLIFDGNKTLIANVDKKNSIRHSKCGLIEKAIDSSTQIDFLGHSDIQAHKKLSFMFLKSIKFDKNTFTKIYLQKYIYKNTFVKIHL